MKHFFASLICGLVLIAPLYAQNDNYKSIHQQELEYYNSQGISAEDYYQINQPENVTQNKSGKSCNLNKIVFGWHPYWSNGLEVNYDWSLLSDLSFFSYEVDAATGNPDNTHGWATSTVVDEALAAGVRVNLCVTLFSNHSTFFGSATAQQNLIDNLISMVQTKGANGVNIDFEGVSSSLEPEFTAFLIDLCTQMHTQIPGSQVSVCTYAVDWGDVFNEAAIDPYIDYYTIMGYAYYYSGSSVAGPTAPLYTYNTFNYNLAKTVNYYQSEGASPEKIVLGLPYYGHEWNTVGSTIPSSTTSSVSSRTYKTVKDNSSGNYSTRQWEPTSLTPYYVYYSSNWRQCFCDDEESLGYRYDLVNMMGIAGIGIWALGYDDGYTELWDLIREKFTDCGTIPCDGTFYDLGGPDKVYFNHSDYTFTIAPTGATQVSLEFPFFDIEAGSGSECDYDYIEIYDGPDTGSPSFGKFCNTTGNPGTITSSGNSLTVHVYTDGATVNDGFEGNWTCVQDNIAPETEISANEWESSDFTASFTDTDNELVDLMFYQVLDNDGSEWRANGDYGFFNDNFESAIHSDWTNLSGTWSISDGHLMQSDETLSNENIYASVTQTSGGTYLYHWQMKMSGSGANRRAGLYVFCSDPELDQRGDAYMIYFRVDDNACQIYKSVSNSIDIFSNDYVNVDADTWYDYKVTVNTNTGVINAYQNDILVSTWTDPSPLASGNSISLRTGNCICEYDDIKVYQSRSASESVTVGTTDEVRYQNADQYNPSCRIKSIITDDAGNWSDPSGLDVNIDWTAPEDILEVKDGPGVDLDTTYVGTELKANWTVANEPNSYLTKYEYCIGLTPGADDFVAWTDNGTSTNVTKTGLTLVSETEYYFNIRATNIVDLTSNVSTSDGILYIDPEDLTIADFTIANTEVCPETPIEFVNLSLNAVSVEWTITGPQNETSTDFEPSIVLTGGDYEIELIAYGTITNDTIVKEFAIDVSDSEYPTASNPLPVSVECVEDIPLPDISVVTDEADNCTATPVVAFVSDVSDGNTCPEIITRTYSVSDDSGNTIYLTQNITVDDNTPPSASSPADIIVECADEIPAPDILVITDESDNCSGDVTVSYVGDISDGNSCPESITRTYSLTDECGNISYIEQQILINDETLPTASNPAPIVVNELFDVPSPDVIVVTDEVDNCTAVPVVAFVSDVSDGNTCPEIITRTYSVTDDCGNSINVQQTITVGPIPEAPDYVTATDLSICTGESTDLYYVGGTECTFSWYTESCGGSFIGNSIDFTVSPTETTTYYGRWENSCGNSECETVTIEVLENPVADFSVLATTVYLPDATAYFTNNSTNADSYYWEFGDGNNSTDYEPFNTYLSVGTYTVSLEAISMECGSDVLTQTDYIIVLDPTMIDLYQSDALIVYPNPAVDRIMVQNTEGQIESLKVVNALGEVVYSSNPKTDLVKIDISDYAEGVYIIKTQMGNKELKAKLVIER